MRLLRSSAGVLEPPPHMRTLPRRNPGARRGCVTVAILLIFYAAPLSSIAEVLRARSSAPLNEPLAFMSIINGGLWSSYGWWAAGTLCGAR